MAKVKSKVNSKISSIRAARIQSLKNLPAKDKLVRVAAFLFAEKGFDSVSTREIASAAKLNISLISYYFGGKKGLYQQTFLAFGENFEKKLEALFVDYSAQNLNREKFIRFLKSIITEIIYEKQNNPEISMLFARELLAGLENARDVFDELFPRLAMKVISVFEEGQKRGIVRKDINPYVHFLLMVHSVDMYFMSSRIESKMSDRILKLPNDIDLLIEQISKTFVEGVCP